MASFSPANTREAGACSVIIFAPDLIRIARRFMGIPLWLGCVSGRSWITLCTPRLPPAPACSRQLESKGCALLFTLEVEF